MSHRPTPVDPISRGQAENLAQGARASRPDGRNDAKLRAYARIDRSSSPAQWFLLPAAAQSGLGAERANPVGHATIEPLRRRVPAGMLTLSPPLMVATSFRGAVWGPEKSHAGWP